MKILQVKLAESVNYREASIGRGGDRTIIAKSDARESVEMELDGDMLQIDYRREKKVHVVTLVPVASIRAMRPAEAPAKKLPKGTATRKSTTTAASTTPASES